MRGAFYSVAVYELDWGLMMRVRTLRCLEMNRKRSILIFSDAKNKKKSFGFLDEATRR